MKKLLLAGALFVAGLAAQAESYSTIALSYDNTHLGANSKGILSVMGYEDKAKSGALNGFGLQYNYGIGISSMPMNVEVGLKLNWGFNTQSYTTDGYYGTYDIKYNTSMMRMNIPVSYIYHFNIKDVFTISPYIGLDFRFNLLAKTKISGNVFYDDGDGYDSDELESESINYFSKDDMGTDTFNRFQMGWHLGARFEYKKIFLGLEYGTDFMPLWSTKYMEDGKSKKYHINTGNFALSLGYKF